MLGRCAGIISRVCAAQRGGPSLRGKEEGKGEQDEGERNRGGGTETKVVIGIAKVTAGCKTSEDRLKDLFWGENCF